MEISKLIKENEELKKEIEEKTTILLAGAEKVKQLEKEIEKLNFENHMIKKWNERLDKNCISKDKIRERIEEARKIKWHTPKLVIEYFDELLEEK